MKFTFSFLCIYIFKVIDSHDSESFEGNRVEVTPIYDTIIISDIADIINEFQKVNFPFDTFINSESESEENIEDLLSEYQNYLDRAHNQRKTYLEKSKIKNKVPLIRHDQYAKGKTTTNSEHDSYYYNNFFNPNTIKFPQKPISTPLDLIIPISSRPKYVSNAPSQLLTNSSGESRFLDKIIREKRPIDILPVLNPGHVPIKSSCYCTKGQFPCKCNCKQCLIPLESSIQDRNEPQLLVFNKKIPEFPQDALYGYKFSQNFETNPDYRLNDLLDNTMDIRVKVDIQLPKTQDDLGRYFNYKTYSQGNEPEDIISKEYMSNINLPLSYFNFPAPMDLLGHKKSSKFSKHDNIRQITIHKKKKSRLNNNKKHKKKVISFHNIKMTSAVPPVIREENNTISADSLSLNNTSERITLSKMINLPQGIESSTIIAPNITDEININETQTEENSWFIVNTNKSEGEKDSHKMENSIETDYTTTNSINVTTEKSFLRKRRDSNAPTEITIKKEIKLEESQEVKPNATKPKNKTYFKKTEKIVAVDTELLYWPNVKKNRSIASSKNITALILEGEHKKSKLNITTDMIRHNRTIALEQAIFGNVDWDDVDIVVPTFISFVGKYLRGILTFCSETKCHSVNCENKKCMHRTCVPKDRLNQKGHCTGSIETDSEASLESIMDLPSNIMFDIVDILQEKLSGKLFGKVTICIRTKCITFVASKKNFITSKCNAKELEKAGSCPSVNSAKIM